MRWWAALALAVPALAGEVRAGKAAVKLAPGSGDEGWVKAIVFEAGGRKAALVACDAGRIEAVAAGAARSLVGQHSDLAPDHVMISATGLAGDRSKNISRGDLPGRIAEAVKLADASKVRVRIGAGAGREDTISFFNRYLMKDGTVRSRPTSKSGIVQPAGEIDPEVAVISFESALYVNFALTPVASAGYPAVLSRLLSRLHAPDYATLFTLGAAANIDAFEPGGAGVRGPADANRIGSILAGETLKTLVRLKPLEGEEVRAASETVALGGTAGAVNGEIQAIALGEIAWVGIPAHLFTELGSAIKKASPFPRTIVVTLANGYIGVVPTRKAFQEGSLDPAPACAAGCGEVLADAAIRLLARLHRAGGLR